MDTFVSIEPIAQNRLNPLRYDNHLRNQISRRNKLYARFQRIPTDDTYKKIKLSRKRAKSMLRSKKKDYYNKLFKSSLENKKSFSRNLNHVLGRKETSPPITSLRVKEVITDDIKIANCLNEHFATVVDQLVSHRNSSINSKVDHIDPVPFSCLFQYVSLGELSSIL